MSKKLNSIDLGIIKPSKWDLQRVKQEIATVLQIESKEIEQINYWLYQISVKIIGKGAKFVSYRCLSLWFESIEQAIEDCQDTISFERLGSIMRYEIEHYTQHYSPDILAKLQATWDRNSPRFQTEEARLQLKIARQQEAWQWEKRWRKILLGTIDRETLDQYYWEISEQVEDFEDCFDTVDRVWDLWERKRRKFDKPGDFWTPF